MRKIIPFAVAIVSFLLFVQPYQALGDTPLINMSGTIFVDGTSTPVAGALVSVGTVHATTDANGQYHLLLPGGDFQITYEITVSHPHYAPYSGTIMGSFDRDTMTIATIYLKSVPWTIDGTLFTSYSPGWEFIAGQGDKIYLATSKNNNNFPQRFVAYDVNLKTYSDLKLEGNDLAACSPASSLVPVNGKLYYFGDNGTVYDTQANTWTGANSPAGVCNSGAGVLGDKIYYIGGRGLLTPCPVYDTTTNTWDTILGYPYDTSSPAVVGYNNRLYVLGGDRTPNKMSMYDPETATWTAMPDIPFSVSVYPRALVYDDKIYLFSGSDIFVYDFLTSAWDPSVLSLPLPVTEYSMVWQPVYANNTMYAVGYHMSSMQYVVAKYTPDTTTPDLFLFTPQTDVALNTLTTSNSITISGFGAAASISITGGGYSINGGEFTSSSGTINNGDTVRVRLMSSGKYSATTSAILTVDGISSAFSVATIAGTNPYDPLVEVSGTISVHGTSRPVAGAIVSVSFETVTATTDADGQYHLLLPPGTYEITVSHPQYAPYSGTITAASYDGMTNDTIYLKFIPWITDGTISTEYWISGWDYAAGQGDKIYLATSSNSYWPQQFIAYDVNLKTYSDLNLAGNELGEGYGSDLVSVNSKLYYFAYHITVYDPQTNLWTPSVSQPFIPREAGVGALGDKIYFIGGDDDYSLTPLNTCRVYDTTTDTWDTIPDYPYYTALSAIVGYNNRLYVLGGNNASNKMTMYDPATATWTAMPDIPLNDPLQLQSPRALVHNDKIYLFAGYDILVYDLLTSAWDTSVLSLPVQPYNNWRPVYANNMMYIVSYDSVAKFTLDEIPQVPDTTAPTTSAFPPGGGGDIAALDISLRCSDGTGSGCAGTFYCLGAGCTPTTAYSGTITITSSNTLRFYSTDNAANTESVKTAIYTLDFEPPPADPITINSGEPYTTSTAATLTLDCTDPVIGCSQMRFSNDNVNWSAPEAYATSKSWTLPSGDGTITVYVQLQDTAGYWSPPFMDTIVLDETGPVTTALPAGGSFTSAQNIALSCNDASGSGCIATLYCLGAGCTPTTWYSEAITISVPNTLRFYSMDIAGNAESVQTEVYTSSVAPLTITTSSLPSVTAGDLYSQGLTASGGVQPYSWAVRGGSLPGGLTIDSETGIISGTPATAGMSSFTVRVMDSNASISLRNLSITINQPQDLPAKVGGYYFASGQEAYDACANDDVLQLREADIYEDLIFDRNISIILSGGYAPDFSSSSSYTTFHGNMIFTNGTVIIENIVIQ